MPQSATDSPLTNGNKMPTHCQLKRQVDRIRGAASFQTDLTKHVGSFYAAANALVGVQADPQSSLGRGTGGHRRHARTRPVTSVRNLYARRVLTMEIDPDCV